MTINPYSSFGFRQYWRPRRRNRFSYANPRTVSVRTARRRTPNFTKKVKQIISGQSETKYLDQTVSSSTPISGTSEILNITLVAQGDTEITRDGDEIYINSLECSGYLTADADETIDTTARLIIFRQVTNCEGTAPIIGDLLESDNIIALRNMDNRGEYKVYMDRFIILKHFDIGSQPRSRIKYYKNFKSPLKCSFDGTGAGIANAEKGHLFIALITGSANTFQPVWDFNIRVKFKDM